MSKYFDILKSSKEFRTLLQKYNKDKQLSQETKTVNIEKILDMKKRQAEDKETEEEYILREMKNGIQFNEEMRNMFGTKAMNHQSKKDISTVKHRVENKNKMKKNKFFNFFAFSTSLKKKDKKSRKQKSSIIPLPLIFPEDKSNLPSIRSRNEGKKPVSLRKKKIVRLPSVMSAISMNTNSSGLTMNSAKNQQYLMQLDQMRDEYRHITRQLGSMTQEQNDGCEEAEQRYQITMAKLTS